MYKYYLSLEAANGLDKLIPPRAKQISNKIYDHTTGLIIPASPMRSTVHNLNGISNLLNKYQTTIPLSSWIDNRPLHIIKFHDSQTIYDLQEQGLLSIKQARDRHSLYTLPKYRLPWYDIDTYAAPHTFRLTDPARKYYYSLALQFNMAPRHRPCITAYVSAAIEAIGIRYIIIDE